MIEDPASTAATTGPDGPATKSGQRAVSADLDHLIIRPAEDDIVDQWGKQSFPASDPPANW